MHTCGFKGTDDAHVLCWTFKSHHLEWGGALSGAGGVDSLTGGFRGNTLHSSPSPSFSKEIHVNSLY